MPRRSHANPRPQFDGYPYGSIAGFAAAGAAFWMAGSTSPDVATAVPQVQLTGSAGGNGNNADG
jgi:hypothetical protein